MTTKKGKQFKGKSRFATESRIIDFIKWLHQQTTAPEETQNHVDEQGFVIFESLSAFIEEEYGFRAGHLIPSMVKVRLIETDYHVAKKIIRIKWRDTVDMSDEDTLSSIASIIRKYMQSMRIATANREQTFPDEKPPQPVTALQSVKEPQHPEQQFQFVLSLVKKAMEDGLFTHINIPEAGVSISINKVKETP